MILYLVPVADGIRRLVLRLVLAAACLASMQVTAFAQETPAGNVDPAPAPQTEEETPQGFRFVFNTRPSFRFGRVLRVDLRLKLQGDLRGFDPDPQELDSFEITRRRGSIQGTIFRHLDYEVEKELRERGAWRDVFVDFTKYNEVQIKVGKFKVPFSMDQTTGSTELDFVFRSLLATNLAPARDHGIMVHGRMFRRLISYEVGGFKRDGENARITEPRFLRPGETPSETDRSVVGRVVVRPFRFAPEVVRNLDVGVGMTVSQIPEGLNSLEGRTVFGERFFDKVYVKGRRQRLGAEFSWTPGPAALRAEYVRTLDERDGQGLGDDTLSDLIATAWSLSGSWALTGEPKEDGMEPRRELLRGGAGAFEVALRFEEMRFGSREKVGTPFRNPRAPHLLENADQVLTVGLNWYLNRWVKIQFNGIREDIEDTERSLIGGESRFWSGVIRTQFRM